MIRAKKPKAAGGSRTRGAAPKTEEFRAAIAYHLDQLLSKDPIACLKRIVGQPEATVAQWRGNV